MKENERHFTSLTDDPDSGINDCKKLQIKKLSIKEL